MAYQAKGARDGAPAGTVVLGPDVQELRRGGHRPHGRPVPPLLDAPRRRGVRLVLRLFSQAKLATVETPLLTPMPQVSRNARTARFMPEGCALLQSVSTQRLYTGAIR